MIHQRRTLRSLALLPALVACLVLAACGGDDTSDDDSTGTPDESTTDTSAETSDDDDSAGEDSDEGANDDTDDESTASGSLTVDGVSYTFTPSLCLPDEANGSSASGAGTADDGSDVYVDLAAGNLSVYLGTDDPMAGDPDYVASSVAGQGSLVETVDGSTISIQASFTEHEATEVVAEGSLEVTC